MPRRFRLLTAAWESLNTWNHPEDVAESGEECSMDAMLLRLVDEETLETHAAWVPGIYGRLVLVADGDNPEFLDPEDVRKLLMGHVKSMREDLPYEVKEDKEMPVIAAITKESRKPTYGIRESVVVYTCYVMYRTHLKELEKTAKYLRKQGVWDLKTAETKLGADARFLEEKGATYHCIIEAEMAWDRERNLLDELNLFERYPDSETLWCNDADNMNFAWDGIKRCNAVHEHVLEDFRVVEKTPMPLPMSKLAFDFETIDRADADVVPKPEGKDAKMNKHACMYAAAMVFRARNQDVHRVLIFLTHPNMDFEKEDLDYKDGKLILVHSEREFIEVFAKQIRAWDPDVITGYNVDGYDWMWIYKRAKHLKCKNFFHIGFLNKCTSLRAKQFDSGAVGKTDSFQIQKLSHRVLADLLPLCKKEFPRERTYRLDAIAKKVTGEGKEDLSYQQQRECYLRGDAESVNRILKYVDQDAWLCILIMEKRSIMEKILALARATHSAPESIPGRGQQHMVYNKLWQFSKRNGNRVMNPTQRDQIKNFEGGAVCEPVKGYHDTMPVEVAAKKHPELSALLPLFTLLYAVTHTWDFMSLYPSIMRTFWICPSNFKVGSKEYQNIAAKVAAGDPPDWKEFLACFAQNEDCVVPALLEELHDLRKKYKKEMKAAMLLAQKAERELREAPRVEAGAQDKRPHTEAAGAGDKRSRISEEGLPESKRPHTEEAASLKEAIREHRMQEDAMDAAQKAVKIVMNSLFGSLGVPREKAMYAEACASATITCAGRTIIGFTSEQAEMDRVFVLDLPSLGRKTIRVRGSWEDFVKDCIEYPEDVVLHSKVVYGDTDSVMPRLSSIVELTPEDHEALGEYFCKEITDYLSELCKSMGYTKPILILEAEKIFLGFLSLSKKRYIGNKKEPGKEAALSITGAQGIRRDTFLAMTRLYRGILEEIIVNKNPAGAVMLVSDLLEALGEGTVDVKDLTFTMQMGRTYKNPNTVGPKVRESAHRKGEEIPAGRRVAYWIGKPKKPKLKVSEKVEYYNGETNEEAEIDFYHYIDYLRKPILELLGYFEDLIDIESAQSMFAVTAACRKAKQLGNRSITDFFK